MIPETPVNSNDSNRTGFSVSAHLLSFLGGCLSGVMFAQVFGGGWIGMMLAYLCILPLYIAALGGGRGPAITAAVFSILAAWLQTSGVGAAVFALMFAVPAMVIGRVSLIQRTKAGWLDASAILQVVMGLGSLLVLVAAMVFSTYDGGLSGSLQKIAESYVAVFQEMNPELTPEQAAEMTSVFATALPSLIIFSWFFVQLVNLTIAQWIVKEMGKQIRPAFSSLAVTLPSYVTLVFAAFVAISYLTNANVSMVLGTIASLMGLGLVLVGLAILHVMIDMFMRRNNWSRAARVATFVFYYVVVMLAQVPLFLALAVGLADPWVKFRNKFNQIEA